MNPLELLFASMTVGELAARSNISVTDLVEVAFTGRSSTRSASKPSAPKSPTSNPGGVARGGLQPDQVLAALRAVGATAKLEDVRSKVGGSVPQVRAALQKLAGARKVTITGQRRGTRYTAK